MAWEIIRNDITALSDKVEVIVNPMHPIPGRIGAGVNRAIHNKAGEELALCLKKLAQGEKRFPVGKPLWTPAFGFPGKTKHLINILPPCVAVKPATAEECEALSHCYTACLQLAKEHQVESIAFPFIGSGNYGFDKREAFIAARNAFDDYFDTNENCDMQVYLVVFLEEHFNYCKNHRSDTSSEIQNEDVERIIHDEYWEGSPEYTRKCIAESQMEFVWYEKECDRILAESNRFRDNLIALMALTINTAKSRPELNFPKTASQFCARNQLDSRHYSNNVVQKPNRKLTDQYLLAYAVGFHLTCPQTVRLMRNGGYYFPDGSTLHEVTKEFIQNGVYDVMRINGKVNELDEKSPLLATV